MSDDPQQQYDEEYQKTNGEIQEVLDALDPNMRGKVFRAAGEIHTLRYNTLKLYAQRLRQVNDATDVDLKEMDTASVNAIMDGFARGEDGEWFSVPYSPGYSQSAMSQFQSALKAFYRYYDDHEVEPEKINIDGSGYNGVDEREIPSDEEIERIISEAESPRNRCIIALLKWTGQRIRIIQTLRVKDVDPGEGVFWIPEVEGRKGQDGKLPLLGAAQYVEEWLQEHPTGNPSDPLFPGRNEGPLRKESIRYNVKNIAERAGVEDIKVHDFRHYFTTKAVTEWGVSKQEIKRMRGDSKNSRIFETVYTHIDDDKLIDGMNEKADW